MNSSSISSLSAGATGVADSASKGHRRIARPAATFAPLPEPALRHQPRSDRSPSAPQVRASDQLSIRRPPTAPPRPVSKPRRRAGFPAPSGGSSRLPSPRGPSRRATRTGVQPPARASAGPPLAFAATPSATSPRLPRASARPTRLRARRSSRRMPRRPRSTGRTRQVRVDQLGQLVSIDALDLVQVLERVGLSAGLVLRDVVRIKLVDVGHGSKSAGRRAPSAHSGGSG